jgi:hypothetical protein
MVPTFSNPTKTINVTGTVDSGLYVTEGDVRAALERTARENGVTVRDLQVTIADGPRTVTLTEDEYNTLRQGGASAQ